jgi:hypothetical protein
VAIRDAQPMPFVPAGLSDSLDGNMSKKGGMLSCSNLISSITTPGMFIPRPAAFQLTNFPGFSSPGYVSCMLQVGTRIWGMIATARNPGYDEPFCFDTATSAFVTISGVTSGNVPASPATSGAWSPPNMCAIGGFVVISHAGYSGANYFGVISGAGGMSPAYSAGNTATNPLPSVPTFCANFNNRVYYACGNLAYFSDVLNPTTITNATQSLTVGGGDSITALYPQPYFATQTGGIAQALLIFKQFGIWQVQGDIALGTLLLNEVIGGIGTQSPRSPSTTPNGVAFLAIDGIRAVGLDGQVSSPVGEVSKPFMTALSPTRVASAYNQGIFRVSVDFYLAGVYEKFEYWWDEIRELWTGPHTLIYDNIISSGSGFVVSTPQYPGALYKTNVLPGPTDSYVEFGTQMTFNYITGVLPEGDSILSEKALIEHTMFLGFSTETQLTFNALDPSYNILTTYSVTTPAVAPSGPTTYGIFWPIPIVFNRLAIQVTGQSQPGLQLGAMYMHYQALGYVNVDPNLSAALPASYDWGLVSDPILTMIGDWGAVADPTVGSVDFGTTP